MKTEKEFEELVNHGFKMLLEKGFEKGVKSAISFLPIDYTKFEFIPPSITDSEEQVLEFVLKELKHQTSLVEKVLDTLKRETNGK